jgi:hypothetical protein
VRHPFHENLPVSRDLEAQEWRSGAQIDQVNGSSRCPFQRDAQRAQPGWRRSEHADIDVTIAELSAAGSRSEKHSELHVRPVIDRPPQRGAH